MIVFRKVIDLLLKDDGLNTGSVVHNDQFQADCWLASEAWGEPVGSSVGF